MTLAEESPSKNSLKRKCENDSEDELFFQFENKKMASLEKPKISQKENLAQPSLIASPKINSPLVHQLASPRNDKTASDSKQATKLVQQKISFGTKSPKVTPPLQASVKEKETVDIVKAPVVTGDNWNIEDFLLDKEWKSLLTEEFSKKYFLEINKSIKEGYKKGINRPPKELVFNALNSTKLNKIKCVIIGQDPYHDDNQAHGLAFSVPIGIRPPPSLKNIYKELETDIPGFVRDEKLGGCLQKWTEEGVFLLNTFLTVEAHKAGSHSKFGWDIFTDRVIKLVSERNKNCVFLLWGAFAQKKECLIDKKKHKIIKCAHPSPFSCTKFFNSKCFSQTNAYLVENGKEPINWSLKY